MKVALAACSLVALVPAMTDGALAAAHGTGGIVLALCSGGSITLHPGNGAPPVSNVVCCAKGCREDERRRRLDQAQ